MCSFILALGSDWNEDCQVYSKSEEFETNLVAVVILSEDAMPCLTQWKW
jgi:hypothetical protein